MTRVLCLITTILVSGCSIEATDQEMVVHFEQNRESFVKLVALDSDCLKDDKPGPVCSKLMKQLNIFSVGKEPTIKEAIAIDFKSFETENKGYLFSKSENVKPIYQNLDTMPAGLGHYEKGYKQINKDWYIFYEYLN